MLWAPTNDKEICVRHQAAGLGSDPKCITVKNTEEAYMYTVQYTIQYEKYLRGLVRPPEAKQIFKKQIFKKQTFKKQIPV